jgi:hypothetical protein
MGKIKIKDKVIMEFHNNNKWAHKEIRKNKKDLQFQYRLIKVINNNNLLKKYKINDSLKKYIYYININV